MLYKELRSQAENALRATRRDIAALTSHDIQGLVHELQVHQIELEMQNESLRCAEREAQESQLHYQVLFDHAPVGYVTLDGRDAIVRANAAAVKLLGLPRSRLLGQRLTAFVAPADAARLQQQVLAARGGTEADCEICLRPPHSHGECQMRVDISLASEGDTTCLVVLTDISERKRHLELLERLNQQLLARGRELEARNLQLEAEVERRTASEQRQHELQIRLHASERFESLGLLAAGIAHDFNNLLVSVLGNAEISLLMPGLPDECRASLSLIKRAGTHAADLTHRLLEFAGKGQRSMGAVDLPALVTENLELLQTRLPHGTQLRTGPMPRLQPIAADRGQINQVVMNLVTNAIEAIGGEGVIEVQTRSVSLDHEALAEFQHQDAVQPGPFAILQVQDDGPGIDAAAISRIFDPFFSTKTSGHGLGLASVLGIVHCHGGALRVHSTPGLGTCFEVALPLLEPVGGSLHAPATPVPDWTGGGSVLLIEDDDHVREVLDRLLTHLGFDVAAASGGADGLELSRLAQHHFRLVMLDWTMPGLSGERILKTLRGVEPRLPVILLSAYGANTLPTSDSCVVHAQKPMTLAQLQEAVCKALGNARVTTH